MSVFDIKKMASVVFDELSNEHVKSTGGANRKNILPKSLTWRRLYLG